MRTSWRVTPSKAAATGRVRKTLPQGAHVLALSMVEGCAMFPASASYDPETLGLLTSVFDEAWLAIEGMLGPRPLDPNSLRSQLAKRIMAAAATGERDPRRLKLIALGAVEG